MRLLSSSTLAIATLSLVHSLTRPAHAEDESRRRARELGYAGVEAYEAGDYAVARENLEKAYRTLSAPSLGTWSARALVKLGRLVEAVERYREVATLDVGAGDASVQKQAKAEASTELANLLDRVPRLIVQIEGALPEHVSVQIDGLSVPVAELRAGYLVNPGSHEVFARSGDTEVRQVAVARESNRTTVVLSFDAPRAEAAEPPGSAAERTPFLSERAADTETGSAAFQRTAGWIGLAAGAAGIAIGGVAGGIALGKLDSIRENQNCHDTTCGPEERELVDSYNGARTIASAGFIAGGVLAAAGVTLLLTLPSSKSQPLAIRVSPGFVSASRSF